MSADAPDSDEHEQHLKASTIMMVDDEETTLDVLEAFLDGEGYENIVATTNSSDAVALIEARRPDVVLLDLQMPDVDGLQILRDMQADENHRRIPVLILTSSTDSETKLAALELGAADFLGKPVDPSELALRLRNTLRAKAYQDRLARYDGLTGLPNRSFFREQATRAIHRQHGRATSCAVFHVDLDRFKQINDALGQRFGDEVLRTVAERLESCTRPGDVVGLEAQIFGIVPPSRLGGDEFSLFVPGVTSADVASRVARRIQQAVSEPIEVEGEALVVTATVGIALYPDDGDDVATLVQNADAATRDAKRTGGNDSRFYSRSLNAESRDRLSLESELRQALSREELELYYQPKVDVAGGQIVACEALMRWNHPKWGFVSPGRFIPVAEECGLIGALGEWAIFSATRQAADWAQAGVKTAMNVSSLQMRNGRLPDTFNDAIQMAGLDGSSFIVELTESMIMEYGEETDRLLNRLKEIGLKISIDDFGTGYSSLINLKLFPLDELKIDCSFLKGIPDDPGDCAIVNAIIGMGHSLGMNVVAEGVERQEQLDFIAERGCDVYQGFLRSPAVPAPEFAEMIKDQE